MVTPSPDNGPSMMLIEGSLTAIAFAIAFALPRLGSSWFARIERAFSQFARRKRLSVLAVGAAALLLRLAILPFCPIPLPFVQDDFSFLLAANTFALGRLTNPTPAMWVHFESIQITMQPTYMSMYFPAQGLILGAGKVLLGHPWFGLLLINALMCAAFCWMLQAWLPPKWALLGGVIAILRIGLFSYWINTYSGGGSVAALGAALLLGGLPRFIRHTRHRDALLMAVGVSLLALSRPYEGLLLCLLAAVLLARSIFFGKRRPSVVLVLRRTALPLAVVLAAVAWLAYYDYRAFGNLRTLPYTVDRAEYAAAPYWIWQSPRPVPVYRHEVIRDFYVHQELGSAMRLHTPGGLLAEELFFKPLRMFLFFAGFALLPPLIMLRRVFMDRRIRFLVVCIAVVYCAVIVETWLIPHYFAAITPAFYALGLQMIRHLRQWRPGGQPVGVAIQRFVVTLCIALAALRLVAEPLHIGLAKWPSGSWASTWHGPGRMGLPRKHIEDQLNQLSGNQLILVRYSPDHSSLDEWVYNAPDIDQAKIIWAREMDAANNQELIHYYKDRTVWLVQPDNDPVSLSPYPAQ
ncbi:MAG TPA: hypothetical protein VN776_14270 [Terracidiphilus sp.]|nr:hypothetical protein [Terracidiphilus sp.]